MSAESLSIFEILSEIEPHRPEPNTEPPTWITTKVAAKIAGVSTRSIQYWATAGLIRSRRESRAAERRRARLLVLREDVLVQSGKVRSRRMPAGFWPRYGGAGEGSESPVRASQPTTNGEAPPTPERPAEAAVSPQEPDLTIRSTMTEEESDQIIAQIYGIDVEDLEPLPPMQSVEDILDAMADRDDWTQIPPECEPISDRMRAEVWQGVCQVLQAAAKAAVKDARADERRRVTGLLIGAMASVSRPAEA